MRDTLIIAEIVTNVTFLSVKNCTMLLQSYSDLRLIEIALKSGPIILVYTAVGLELRF